MWFFAIRDPFLGARAVARHRSGWNPIYETCQHETIHRFRPDIVMTPPTGGHCSRCLIFPACLVLETSTRQRAPEVVPPTTFSARSRRAFWLATKCERSPRQARLRGARSRACAPNADVRSPLEPDDDVRSLLDCA